MRDLGAILQKARETAKNSGNSGNSGNGLENLRSINSLTKPVIVPTADMGVGTVGTDQVGVPTVPINIEEVGTSSFEEITKQNQTFVQSVPTVPTVPTENSNSSEILEQVAINRCFVCGERETAEALFVAVLTSRPGTHHWLHAGSCHNEHMCATRLVVKSEPFGRDHLACCLDPSGC